MLSGFFWLNCWPLSEERLRSNVLDTLICFPVCRPGDRAIIIHTQEPVSGKKGQANVHVAEFVSAEGCQDLRTKAEKIGRAILEVRFLFFFFHF